LFVSVPRITRREVLCCDLRVPIDDVLAQAEELRRRSGLPVVSVANVDLGYLSLKKQVNVIDLGSLGEPVLAKLWKHAEEQTGSTAAISEYLDHYAAPDLVVLGGSYACHYRAWLRSERFRATYRQVQDDTMTAAQARRRCSETDDDPVPGGHWVRADLLEADAPEVVLSARLARDPDPALVRRELEACDDGGAWSCQYVTRSVYRNLRAFEAAGTLAKVIAEFRPVTSAAYDTALLSSRSRGDWYWPAVTYIESNASP
jgi:hypothetical protein